MEKTEKTFWDLVVTNIDYGFVTYRDFIFGLICGLFFAWVYHRLVGNYSLKESYRVLLAAKEETNQALKELVSSKLSKIQVPQQDAGFFKKLKRYFRKRNS